MHIKDSTKKVSVSTIHSLCNLLMTPCHSTHTGPQIPGLKSSHLKPKYAYQKGILHYVTNGRSLQPQILNISFMQQASVFIINLHSNLDL